MVHCLAHVTSKQSIFADFPGLTSETTQSGRFCTEPSIELYAGGILANTRHSIARLHLCKSFWAKWYKTANVMRQKEVSSVNCSNRFSFCLCFYRSRPPVGSWWFVNWIATVTEPIVLISYLANSEMRFRFVNRVDAKFVSKCCNERSRFLVFFNRILPLLIVHGV